MERPDDVPVRHSHGMNRSCGFWGFLHGDLRLSCCESFLDGACCHRWPFPDWNDPSLRIRDCGSFSMSRTGHLYELAWASLAVRVWDWAFPEWHDPSLRIRGCGSFSMFRIDRRYELVQASLGVRAWGLPGGISLHSRYS